MKTVLITGASAGIGKETAKVFAEKNYNLVLVARRKDALESLKNEILINNKVEIQIIDLDLSLINSAEKLYEITQNQNLKIDVLVNNAGFGLFDSFLLHDPHKLEQMLVLNMITLTKLSQLFGNKMVANGGGNIVNIASTAAFQPMPHLAVYAATKSYVMNFSDAIAYELKDKNIKVTCINPGATNSEFAQVANFTSSVIQDNKIPSSRDLAVFIYDVMKQGKTNTTHGLKNSIMAWSNRFVPRTLSTKIAAKIVAS